MNDYQRRTVMLAIVAVSVPCAGFITGLAGFAVHVFGGSTGPECARPADKNLSEFRHDDDAARLVGRCRRGVVAELGEPTSRRFAPEWDMSYWLRPQGFCMDGWYLVLNTSSDGVVTDAAILGD